MSKQKNVSTIETIFSILGKICLFASIPLFLIIVLGYALLYLIINLIFLAINQFVKGNQAAGETFSDQMHDLGVSLLDLFKNYFLFVFGF